MLPHVQPQTISTQSRAGLPPSPAVGAAAAAAAIVAAAAASVHWQAREEAKLSAAERMAMARVAGAAAAARHAAVSALTCAGGPTCQQAMLPAGYMVAQTSFRPPPPPGVAPPVPHLSPPPTMLPAAAPSVAEAPPAEAPPVATHPNLVTMMTQLRQQLGLDETKMLGDLESAAEALGFVSDRNLTTGARIKALWHVACSFHVV